jgi:hypothetical protein
MTTETAAPPASLLPTEPSSPPAPSAPTTLDEVRSVADRLRARLKANVMGRDDVIELVLVALFGDGHVLLEDYPGSGKTTLAKALGSPSPTTSTATTSPTFAACSSPPTCCPAT